ncbi:uncharacterized protein LOC128860889 [Anastrepha ludens]|uniref:uncharacterized protein LOC128860889 n=1 Tax=Anastrepha ludens TaxID=28586 RepID=UPI0023B1077A|nr:uncharacterized protein LOC128860889 [Anastrepha ludens]
MAPKAQFTLEEITKIALGAPELTSTSVHVLHSLVDVLLKKIGCQNDTVSICGVESDCLAELLNKSKSTPINFDDKQVTIIAPELNNIVELEKSVDELQIKLNDHINSARKFNQLPQMKFDIKDWEKIKDLEGSRCIACEEDQEIACYLTSNIDFLKKLQRRLAEPMVLNLFQFEQEISALNEDMNTLIANVAEKVEKFALIEASLLAVEKVRAEIDLHNYTFLGAMEEIQDILDFKLDKIQIPALKRYVMLHFKHIDSHVRSVQYAVDCPKYPGTITSGVRCLSCGDRNVCIQKGVHPTGILPDAHAFKPTRLPRVCECKTEKEEAKKMYVANVVPTLITKENIDAAASTATVVSIDDCTLTCRENYEFLKGTDGLLYRKG